MKSSLRAGSSLSHYRVIAPLGAGGMGEVYKAQDTTLGRTIALKVLPPELVRNEERVRRFVQEARSASSLSHPHIVTVHEIGQATVRPNGEPDGAPPAEAPVYFIAMEFVDGATLRAKIHDEKTDLRALLGHLAQAADGLAKAHAAGIVHRDLKPDNIMITRDGYAKVLDFGLAKLSEPGSPADQLAGATRDVGALPTREGSVLGTVGYMSPEQVQGKTVDQRSDIFSFGCMLYEAATRHRPFEGDSDIDVMHKILHERPAPVDQLNPEAPAELRRLVRRCLAKDPERRYQSMKDLAIELADIVEEYDQLSPASSSGGSSGTTQALPLRPRRGAGFWIGVSAAGLAVAVAVFIGAFALAHRRGAGTGASTFPSMKITSLTGTGKVRTAAISPDGKYVVQAVEEAGKQSLWIRQVATGSDVQIVPPGPPYTGVTFAPDGNYAYFTRAERDVLLYSLLYQVPVLGGTPRKLIFDVDTPVTFSPDGKLLAFARGYPDRGESTVMIAGADGAGERKLAVRKDPEAFELSPPAWSPDGKTIAAFATSLEGGFHLALVAVGAEDGKTSPIGTEHWFEVDGLAWLPDGSGLVLAAATEATGLTRQIWLVTYPGGAIRKITNDLSTYHGVSLTADSRTLVTVQTNQVANLWLAPSAETASARQVTMGLKESVAQIRWSAAGPIVYRALRNGTIDLWMSDADGASQKRLTTESAKFDQPVLANDGSFILCTSYRNGDIPHVWRLDPDGGNPAQLTSGPGEELLDLAPDGQWFVYRSIGPARELWRMPIGGGEPLKLAAQCRGGGLVSRDGKRIVNLYLREEGNRFASAVGFLPAKGGGIETSFDAPEGVGEGRWAPSSDALTYVMTRDGVSNLWSQPLDGSPARRLTDFKSGRIFSFDWSPDGKRLALARGDVVGDVVLLSDFR